MPHELVLLEGGSLRISGQDALSLKGGRLPEQMFFEAIMARVETNRNRDRITAKHLQEVAATIAHTPIDDEHKQHVVQGHILSARFDPTIYNKASGTYGALLTSNVTWPRRFPDIALGLLEGTVKFSLESAGEKVECSTCGEMFATTVGEADYCACLQSRRTTGSTDRLWHNNRGIGSAFTTNPAGTDCDANEASIVLVASYDQEASPPSVSEMLTASVFAAEPTIKEKTMDPEKIKALVAGVLAAVVSGSDFLASDPDEAKVIAAIKPTVVNFLAEQKTAQDAALKAAEEKLTAAYEARLADEKAAGEKALVAEKRLGILRTLPLTVPEPEKQAEMVASFTEAQWEFTLAAMKTAEEKAAVAPADPVAPPAIGAALLAGSAQGGAEVPGANVPAQGSGAGTGEQRPTKLSDWKFTRARTVLDAAGK